MARDRKAFLDYWSLSKNFRRGDVVNTYNPLTGILETVPGIVTAVHPGIGFVDIEYPWGNERVSPEFLVRLNPEHYLALPSVIDTSYSGWDIAQSHLEDGTDTGYSYAKPRVASSMDVDKLAADFDDRQRALTVAAAECLHKGKSNVEAYRHLLAVAKGRAGDHEVLRAVVRVYHPNQKHALYWNAPGRKYRMNQGELDDGLPNCPRCGTNLQKSNYAKHMKLFVCPVCVFAIKPEDIEGLPEYVAESGFGVGDEEDIKTAALKTAAWDRLKKQVEAYVARTYPDYRKYAPEISQNIRSYYGAKMNIHEDVLPTKELEKAVREEMESVVNADLQERAKAAIKAVAKSFRYADEALDSMVDYLMDLSFEQKLAVDEDELIRLVDIQKTIDLDRTERYRSAGRIGSTAPRRSRYGPYSAPRGSSTSRMWCAPGPDRTIW
jgi:hypothetical protein